MVEKIDSPKGREEVLVDYLKEVQPEASNRHGLYFHTSKLKSYNRSPSQLKKAQDFLKNIFQEVNGEVFTLSNGDMVCIVIDASITHLERLIIRFKRNFSQDPLLQYGMNTENFYRIYDLNREAKDFRQSIDNINRLVREGKIDTEIVYGLQQTEGLPSVLNGIDVQTLAVVQSVLKHADVSNFLRRQAICWIDSDLKLHPVHYQYYLSVQVLQEILNVSESMSGNIWIFKQLTTFLDRQMLRLTKSILSQKSITSVHFNINLRTIITQQFREFISHFQNEKQLTFEIDILDILAHPDVFSHLSELIKAHECQLCVNGINLSNFHWIAPNSLSSHKVKISAAGSISQKDWDNESLTKWIQEVGADRIIVHHCDSEEIIQYAVKQNIHHFQGRHVDILLKNLKNK